MENQIATAHAVLVVVRTDDDRFVLVQEAKESCKGQWSVPGGILEPGESVFDAGVREVAEEAGVLVEPIGLLLLEHLRFVTDVEQPAEKFRYIISARYLSGNLKVVADAESLCAKPFSLEQAATLTLRDRSALKWFELARDGRAMLPFERYSFRTI